MHSKWKWKSARSCIKSKRKLKREGWEEKSKESQTFYSLTAAQIDKHDRGQLCATSCYPSGNPLVPSHTHIHRGNRQHGAPKRIKNFTILQCSQVQFFGWVHAKIAKIIFQLFGKPSKVWTVQGRVRGNQMAWWVGGECAGCGWTTI